VIVYSHSYLPIILSTCSLAGGKRYHSNLEEEESRNRFTKRRDLSGRRLIRLPLHTYVLLPSFKVPAEDLPNLLLFEKHSSAFIIKKVSYNSYRV
jgi:hypothetical protein